MQAKHRAYIEILVFLALCAAIGWVARGSGGGVHSVLNAGAQALALTVLFGFGIGALWWLSSFRPTDISLLTGALWDLIRSMETRSRAAPGNRNNERKQLLQEFAVEGAHKVGAGRPMPMGDTAALDLTRLAFELMDRNDKEGGGYSARVNSLRRGLFVFYALFKLKKPELAYRAMCEHMKTQIRLGEDSGIDNFTELKQLLNLPREWPRHAGAITQLEDRGLPRGRQVAIRWAVNNGKAQVFAGVHYTPPGQTLAPGEKPVSYHDPGDILDQMREYIR